MEMKLIGEYLIAGGKISNDQLQRALEMQANSIQGGRMPLLGTILVEQKALPERELTLALEEQERDRQRLNTTMYPPETTESLK